MGENVGILLSTGRDKGDGETAVALAREALARGDRVHLFLVIDGVEWAADSRFVSLVTEGAKVSVCALNAEQRGVAERPELDWASQYVLAQVVAHSDRFVAYT